MSALDSKGRCPQDIVAIFHASFHPTQGNIIDWSVKANDDLNLSGLEFSALPSGLHLVEEDVVYFTSPSGHAGVCIFRRRKTIDKGHRGFRLSSLGVLLAKSARPRPWRHVAALKEVTSEVYERFESAGSAAPLVQIDTGEEAGAKEEWARAPARAFFEERKVRRADLGGAGDWEGWSAELLERTSSSEDASNPTLHLPHLLRILGPSSLTLYKHALGRRRILIYTLPPVEAAGVLARVVGDMGWEWQVQLQGEVGEGASRKLKAGARHKDPITVLGMVTLNDLERMQREGESGRGWVACTTDALFLEKPACYDLLVDLTTSSPARATRPTFYSSKPIPVAERERGRGPTHRLSVVRFSWSDVKLWNEINRILQLDSSAHSHSHPHPCCAPGSLPPDSSSSSSFSSFKPPSANSKSSNAAGNFITAWTDAWRVYEDVCVICAGLWMGSWRGNSALSYSTAEGAANWGSVRLEGDEDLSLRALSARAAGAEGDGDDEGQGEGHVIRSVGMGIEGGPQLARTTTKGTRRSSAMSWSSGRATVTSPTSPSSPSKLKGKAAAAQTRTVAVDDDDDGEGDTYDSEAARRDGQILTTLSLLQTLHAHTAFQLSTLEAFLPSSTSTSSSSATPSLSRSVSSPASTSAAASSSQPTTMTLTFTPKDMAAFELGALSGMDARYLEWLALEYGWGAGVRGVVVKRGWREMLGAIFGYG